MDQLRLPKRVVLNFANRCNMHCAFCYIPFDGREANEDTALKVLDEISRWGVSNLTVGGGDPLMYPYLPSLLAHARTSLGHQAILQLDTNGLGLRPSLLERIAHDVDTIGLPIETTSCKTAAKMGRGSTYPAHLTRTLSELMKYHVPIKINTVVTALNVGDIRDVGILISQLEVRLWSIYQFWLIADSPSVTFAEYALSDEAFIDATSGIQDTFPNLRIEIGTIVKRAHAYFFVTHTGRAYTIAQAREKDYRYIELGSIFESQTLQQWARLSDPAANALRAKMRASDLCLDGRNAYRSTGK